MDNFKDIGKIVRFHRKKSNLSQAELATLAGVGKTVIYDIEKGKKTIRLNTLNKVLVTLNIKLIVESRLTAAYESDAASAGQSK